MSRHPGRRARRVAAAFAVLLVGLAGCDGGTGAAGGEASELTREQFVAVVVALREAEIELQQLDSPTVEFAGRRDRILAEHGVTAEQLREYLARHGGTESLEELWDTILQRLKYVPPRYDPRKAPPDPDTGGPVGGVPDGTDGSARDTASRAAPSGRAVRSSPPPGAR